MTEASRTEQKKLFSFLLRDLKKYHQLSIGIFFSGPFTVMKSGGIELVREWRGRTENVIIGKLR